MSSLKSLGWTETVTDSRFVAEDTRRISQWKVKDVSNAKEIAEKACNCLIHMKRSHGTPNDFNLSDD